MRLYVRVSVNIPCGCGTFCQLFLHPRDVPSTYVNFPCSSEIFNVAAGHSINFRHISLVLWDLPSTFSASVGPFLNFCQLSVRPQYLPSTSVNFLCTCGIFRKQSARPQNLPSASAGLTVNLRQLFVRPVDFPSTFLASAGPVNFVQLPSVTR